MKKAQQLLICFFVLLLMGGCCATTTIKTTCGITGTSEPALDASELPKTKQTTLGLYVSAKEAYEKWRLNPDGIKILDCRTPEEYAFVGHAPMACNIPKMFYTYKYDAEKKKPVMVENPEFMAYIKKALKKTDTIFIMCRSGGRSAKSVNMLAEAGYKNVYNIIDGFEGDKIKDSGSYFNGKRIRNGWKNSGAPWTYKLDPKLMYLPAE